MGNTFYYEWEMRLLLWLQESAGDLGAAVASLITYCGEELVIIAVLGFVYWCYDKNMGRYLGINICIGIVLNPLVKNIFVRRRPYFDNTAIKCLKPVAENADIYDISAQGYSFPSGHSTNAAITYVGMGVYKKKRLPIMIGGIVAALVAVSRMMLGVHYPTDVIAGLAMGVCTLLFCTWLLKKIDRRWVLYLIVFTVSCVGLFYCRTSDYFSALGTMAGFFLGDLFEERYVGFENTRVWYKCILRLAGGCGLFLGLNSLLKLPFSPELLASTRMIAFLIRFIRYTVVTFVIVGLYPKIFSREE